MNFNKNDLTIRKLRELNGDMGEVISDEISPLSVWYAGIQNIQLLNLDDGDVAKLIRQNLILEFAIPESIRRLNQLPTAGKIYVGELMNSFNHIKCEFWTRNVICTKESCEFFKRLKSHPLLVHFQWELEEEKQDYFSDLKKMISTLEEVLKRIGG
ncbi:contact-dependent growth inhibition system immunity protein [Paenibacillus wenxiniae]|uniref:Contact-dependent growth inhibition system immunity protein n=1 Tax=Paenibacillus wenxiniae TaxID=1636843 RepID=A0ABW4RJJ3_9BACL